MPNIFDIHVTLKPDLTLTGSFKYADSFTGVRIGGSENLWSDTIGGAHLLPNNCGFGCNITGYWIGPVATHIPEPASVGIFAGSLMLVALLRRRRRQ